MNRKHFIMLLCCILALIAVTALYICDPPQQEKGEVVNTNTIYTERIV